MKQILLDIGPEVPPTLDDFVPAGAAVVAHLRALQAGSPPVYLWGPSGSGKTHLLQSLARLRQSQGERVGWFDADTSPPWSVDEAWALVVIDDCDRLDPVRQQAAFTVFVDADSRRVQLATAGRLPPVDLPVREDLRTRLGWGHIYALTPLAEPEVRGALRRLADRRGVLLSDEVMDYLLTRFARDLKHLVALLEKLDGFSLAHHRAVTVPLIKLMLAEEGPPR